MSFLILLLLVGSIKLCSRTTFSYYLRSIIHQRWVLPIHFNWFCFARRIKFSSVVPFGMSAPADTANIPSDNPQRTKEHKPAPKQSNIHEHKTVSSVLTRTNYPRRPGPITSSERLPLLPKRWEPSSKQLSVARFQECSCSVWSTMSSNLLPIDTLSGISDSVQINVIFKIFKCINYS